MFCLFIAQWARPIFGVQTNFRDMSKEDRRVAVRHIACVAAEFAGDDERVGVVHNISASGVLLLTRRALPQDEPVDITLVFSSASGPDSRRTVRGAVVRSARRVGANAVLWRYETAVAFEQPLGDADRELAAIAREQQDSFRGSQLPRFKGG